MFAARSDDDPFRLHAGDDGAALRHGAFRFQMRRRRCGRSIAPQTYL
jgi:hypothetical protein